MPVNQNIKNFLVNTKCYFPSRLVLPFLGFQSIPRDTKNNIQNSFVKSTPTWPPLRQVKTGNKLSALSYKNLLIISEKLLKQSFGISIQHFQHVRLDKVNLTKLNTLQAKWPNDLELISDLCSVKAAAPTMLCKVKVSRVKFLGNLITFFAICFCSPIPY